MRVASALGLDLRDRGGAAHDDVLVCERVCDALRSSDYTETFILSPGPLMMPCKTTSTSLGLPDDNFKFAGAFRTQVWRFLGVASAGVWSSVEG